MLVLIVLLAFLPIPYMHSSAPILNLYLWTYLIKFINSFILTILYKLKIIFLSNIIKYIVYCILKNTWSKFTFNFVQNIINVSNDAAYLPQVYRVSALWKKEHKASLSRCLVSIVERCRKSILWQLENRIAILCTLTLKTLISQWALSPCLVPYTPPPPRGRTIPFKNRCYRSRSSNSRQTSSIGHFLAFPLIQLV
jgi:hypothetical protein